MLLMGDAEPLPMLPGRLMFFASDMGGLLLRILHYSLIFFWDRGKDGCGSLQGWFREGSWVVAVLHCQIVFSPEVCLSSRTLALNSGFFGTSMFFKLNGRAGGCRFELHINLYLAHSFFLSARDTERQDQDHTQVIPGMMWWRCRYMYTYRVYVCKCR